MSDESNMGVEVSRVLIAATASGVGKTTIACGLLRVLQRRGLCMRACKCGPDFIDPAFHRAVLGIPSCNLDLFLADQLVVRELLTDRGKGADVTLMEGAMGYYDGIAQSADASAYDVARVTQTPVVLVVDARGRALSVAAEVMGFLTFRTPSFIAGVLLNHASDSYYPQLKQIIERECGVPVIGYVPELKEVRLPSRHLGLVMAGEVADLATKVDALADVLQKTVDIDVLLSVARSAPALEVEAKEPFLTCEGHPVIAVARDEAFCFYYEESLGLLERMGARLAYFSPLRDKRLPVGVQGLYVGGGYPELHAAELSRNVGMLASVREEIASGMPTIAECGGFLYLHDELEDSEGIAWPMVGTVPAHAYGRGRLGRFGYVTLTARRDGLLADVGGSVAAHEFHYWESERPGDAFRAQKPQSSRGWDCAISTPSLYAGFPHLYLNGCPDVAKRFVDACAAFGAGRGAC